MSHCLCVKNKLVLLLIFISLWGPALSLNQLFGALKRTPTVARPSATSIKNQIRCLAKGTKNGIHASASVKEEIGLLANKLADLNPTSSLTTSPLLNGVWKLVYTSNEGSSAGKLGPFVGRVDQVISLPDKKYQNIVRIGGTGDDSILEGSLSATWESLNKRDWEVQFIDLTLKLFNKFVIAKQKLEAKGTWKMTYVDSDFRILYAIGGKNTNKSNIYILEKEKDN